MYGGKFEFQNRLGQLVMARKFTIFALFYFVFEGKFQVQVPRGAYIRRSDLTEGFLRYDFEGLIFGILRYLRNFSGQDKSSYMGSSTMKSFQKLYAQRAVKFFHSNIDKFTRQKKSQTPGMFSHKSKTNPFLSLSFTAKYGGSIVFPNCRGV